LLISAELDETLAHRIAVMYRGQIMAVVDAKDSDKASLGLLMAGVQPANQPVPAA